MTGAVGATKCCKCCSGHNWERAGDQFFGPPPLGKARRAELRRSRVCESYKFRQISLRLIRQ